MRGTSAVADAAISGHRAARPAARQPVSRLPYYLRRSASNGYSWTHQPTLSSLEYLRVKILCYPFYIKLDIAENRTLSFVLPNTFQEISFRSRDAQGQGTPERSSCATLRWSHIRRLRSDFSTTECSSAAPRIPSTSQTLAWKSHGVRPTERGGQGRLAEGPLGVTSRCATELKVDGKRWGSRRSTQINWNWMGNGKDHVAVHTWAEKNGVAWNLHKYIYSQMCTYIMWKYCPIW